MHYFVFVTSNSKEFRLSFWMSLSLQCLLDINYSKAVYTSNCERYCFYYGFKEPWKSPRKNRKTVLENPGFLRFWKCMNPGFLKFLCIQSYYNFIKLCGKSNAHRKLFFSFCNDKQSLLLKNFFCSTMS